MTRYRWVLAQRAEGFATSMCWRAGKVSTQAFYDWRRRCGAGPTPRERAEAALVAEIGGVHAASGGTYGSPRVTAELRSRGHRVNPKRVARLMRAHRIAGIRPRRPKRTTTAARSAPRLPDLVGRRFAVGAPDRAWVSDITYVRTDQGWLYLAVVLDLGSRRLLGYQMSDRIDTRLVADAIDMAANTRAGRTAGIVFHCDRGSQYLAGKLRACVAGWDWASRQAVSGRPRTTRWPRRSSPASNENLVHQHRQASHQPELPNPRRTRSLVPSHHQRPTRLNQLTGQRGEVPLHLRAPGRQAACHVQSVRMWSL